MNETPRVNVMLALKLLAERAHERDDLLAFAIVDEAATLAGFCPGAIATMLYDCSADDALDYRDRSRRYRRAVPLRAKGKGLLLALTELADAGVLDGCSQARHEMWLAQHADKPVAENR